MIAVRPGKYKCRPCGGTGFRTYHGGDSETGDAPIMRTYAELLSTPASKMQVIAYSKRLLELVGRITKGAKLPKNFKPADSGGGNLSDASQNHTFRAQQTARHKNPVANYHGLRG